MNPKIIAAFLCAVGLAVTALADGTPAALAGLGKGAPPAFNPIATQAKASFEGNRAKAMSGIRELVARDLDLNKLFTRHDVPRIVFSQPPSPALPSEGHFHDEWYPSITFRF